jgi:hypothetical protein
LTLKRNCEKKFIKKNIESKIIDNSDLFKKKKEPWEDLMNRSQNLVKPKKISKFKSKFAIEKS